jgi:hypothetical protein
LTDMTGTLGPKVDSDVSDVRISTIIIYIG